MENPVVHNKSIAQKVVRERCSIQPGIILLLLPIIFSTYCHAQSADSSRLTEGEQSRYANEPIMEELGITSLFFNDLGSQIDSVLLLNDVAGILSFSQLLATFEKASGKTASSINSAELKGKAAQVIDSRPLKELDSGNLKLIIALYHSDGNTEGKLKYESLLAEFRAYIEENPPVRTRGRGLSSYVTVINQSNSPLYFFVNGLYKGKVFKTKETQYEIPYGCNEVLVKTIDQSTAMKELCLDEEEDFQWKIQP